MATHEELISLYSEDGVILLDEAASKARGLPDEEAAQLARTGLPTFVDVLFTLKVRGAPRVFSLLPVETGEETVAVFILGGPTDDAALRYFLDLRRGYVVLLAGGPEGSQAEIVNATLADFTEFLYRVSLHKQETAQVPVSVRSSRARELRTRLAARDPLAFAAPDSWWSMIMDALEGPRRPDAA
ncbi:SUKH-4 family immunity protein [Streptomyces sp. NA04227]|uniref:SUKH-4 family immunity protein n=1 Tax=Streptomyces sp. NA04227 TaxID=2742136 RepID=UPI0015901500|nr:SUKH-4 family immunity protein [Streptomyces sp. NA04227]QKW08852.1 SUKH-4 family immunity protein [Streptomyces sp. NA04227]